jgi:FkbM family methyltransferase
MALIEEGRDVMKPRNGEGAEMTLRHVGIHPVVWRGKKYRFLVADEHDEIQKRHLAGKVYEEEELELLVNAGREWREMVDVGANVGNHSIALNGHFHFRKITVFEPNPQAAELLRLNIVLNTLPSCNPFSTIHMDRVVSDINDAVYRGEEVFPNNLGSTAFYEIRDSEKNQHDAELAVADQQRSFGDEVRSVTLDYALGPASTMDFLKIDVEGMEVEVLRGACSTISRLYPDLYIEFSHDKKHLLDEFCEKYGYRIEFDYNRYPGLSSYLLLPLKGRLAS